MPSTNLTEEVMEMLSASYGCNMTVAPPAASSSYTSHSSREKAEILYFSLIIMLGVPLNVAAFRRCVNKLREQKIRRKSSVARRKSAAKAVDLLLLSLNLNITDLLILCVYLPTQIGWRLTVAWRGGDLLCRLLRFTYQFAFHLSSYIIVCIATERLLAVRRSARHGQRKPSMKKYLVLAWLWSFVCSVPNFFIWRTFAPWPEQNPEYVQCTTQFIVQSFRGTSEGLFGPRQALFYHIGGLLTVFWIPLVYISTVYTYIFFQLRGMGRAPIRSGVSTECEVSEIYPEAAHKMIPTHSLRRKSSSALRVKMRRLSTAVLGRQLQMAAVSTAPNLLSTAEDGEAPAEHRRASEGAPMSLNPQWRTRLRNKHKVFSQTGLLVIVYLCCWLPYFVSALGPHQLKILGILIGMNAAVDPLIYAFD